MQKTFSESPAHDTASGPRFKPLLLLRKHSAGMFSHVNTSLTSALLAIREDYHPIIDQTIGMNSYRTSKNENVWDTFFQQPWSISEAQKRGAKTRLFDISEYRRKRFILNRTTFPLVKHYCQIKKEIVDRANILKSSYGLNEPYICLYFRGTDKKKEVREPAMRSYIEKLLPIATVNPSMPVLVQTDDERFVQFTKGKVANEIVVDELRRSQSGQPLHYGSSLSGFESGVESIVVMLLLAGARYLIKNQSNVSYFASLYRTNADGVIQIEPRRG